MKIQIFDPPMCCSTGVCGPSIDPELVQLAANLDWLRRQGIEVERYNLSQQPAAFVNTPVVKAALAAEGNDCLPLTMVDGDVLCRGHYPSQEILAGLTSRGVRPAASGTTARRLRVMQPGGCCGPSAGAVASFEGKRGKGGCC
jgi:arsenite methyltransferase